jgi:hypothetical protein
MTKFQQQDMVLLLEGVAHTAHDTNTSLHHIMLSIFCYVEPQRCMESLLKKLVSLKPYLIDLDVQTHINTRKSTNPMKCVENPLWRSILQF